MTDEKESKLIHRDDVPMDVAEELVTKLKELHPGMKVVFVGDVPTDEQDNNKGVETAKVLSKAMKNGVC